MDVNHVILEHQKWLQGNDGEKATLCGCRLQGYLFENINLMSADLRAANLCHASFKGTNLTCTDFRGADLSHCNFINTNLAGVRFNGANLYGVVMKNTRGFEPCAIGARDPDPELLRKVAERKLAQPKRLSLMEWAIYLAKAHPLEKVTSRSVAAALLIPDAQHMFFETRENVLAFCQEVLK